MQYDGPSGQDQSSLAERVAARMRQNSAALAPPAFRPASPVHAVAPAIPTERPAGRFRNDAVEARAGQPSVVHLNYNRLQALGFTTPVSPRNGNTEEFRVIKRQLLKTAFSEGRTRRSGNSNVIMVTSSVPGEGKTFMALNLALSLAMERDLYVLMVDSDNHRHSLSTLVGVDPGSVGLVDLLIDRALKFPDIIRRTDLPNLTVIGAGTAHPHGAELLSSKDMAKMMGDLAMRYPDRIIIIDTPPVLASTEAVVLSAHVGHAVVVVEKDRTTKRQLRRTLEMLEECKNVSCILNRDTAEQRFSEYAYGY